MKASSGKVLVQTTLASDDRDQLDALADREKRTRADYVRQVLEKHIHEKNGRRRKAR